MCCDPASHTTHEKSNICHTLRCDPTALAIDYWLVVAICHRSNICHTLGCDSASTTHTKDHRRSKPLAAEPRKSIPNHVLTIPRTLISLRPSRIGGLVEKGGQILKSPSARCRMSSPSSLSSQNAPPPQGQCLFWCSQRRTGIGLQGSSRASRSRTSHGLFCRYGTSTRFYEDHGKGGKDAPPIIPTKPPSRSVKQGVAGKAAAAPSKRVGSEQPPPAPPAKLVNQKRTSGAGNKRVRAEPVPANAATAKAAPCLHPRFAPQGSFARVTGQCCRGYCFACCPSQENGPQETGAQPSRPQESHQSSPPSAFQPTQSICHMYMSHVYVTCICHMYMSHVYVTCICHMYMSHVYVTLKCQVHNIDDS